MTGTVVERSAELPDDRRAGWRPILPLAATTMLSVGLATLTVPAPDRSPLVGFAAGAAAALLAVFCLRSVPARWTARVVVLVGAVMMVRFGRFGDDSAGLGSLQLVAWVAVTCAALVLANRLEARGSGRFGSVASTVVVVASLVASGALFLGPVVATRLSETSRRGDPADLRDRTSDNALVLSGTLDMTERPRLSDRVVMTVRADRESFWRGQTFDVWDGRTWRRSDSDVRLVGANGEIRTDEFDLAARDGAPLRQEFRIEARYSEMMPAAPSAVRVESAHAVAQWSDGTVFAGLEPIGPGAAYVVESRQLPVTDTLLDQAGSDVPAPVRLRYAAEPVATDRVARLAREITAGATSDLARVRAIEAWMGANTTYSLDAPLAPRGVDVVDHFLFESRVGWCEQVASSLVVLARLNGVPARLVTGFVPGSWDPITQRYRVREKDAHAWAEVWFPRYGWVGFDPTADVPLAGDAASGAASRAWWLEHLAGLLLALAVTTAAAGPTWRLVRRLATGLRGRTRRAPSTWAGDMERRLEELGERHGRPRSTAQTLGAYVEELAACLGVPELRQVRWVLEREVFGPAPPTEAERRAAAAVLDRLEELLRETPRSGTSAG